MAQRFLLENREAMNDMDVETYQHLIELQSRSIDHKRGTKVDLIKLSKHVNPITGKRGNKVSSKKMKHLWQKAKEMEKDGRRSKEVLEVIRH